VSVLLPLQRWFRGLRVNKEEERGRRCPKRGQRNHPKVQNLDFSTDFFFIYFGPGPEGNKADTDQQSINKEIRQIPISNQSIAIFREVAANVVVLLNTKLQITYEMSLNLYLI
jgi:hypothetical protein